MKKHIRINIFNIIAALLVLSTLCFFYLFSYNPTEASTPDTIGEQKTLVALFNYADDHSQPITVEQVKNHIMYDTQSVNNFVKENSYNKAWLNPTFMDWHTLPSDAVNYRNDKYLALRDAVKVLDDEVYFPDYKRLIFFFLPFPQPGGGYSGWAYAQTDYPLSSDDGNFYPSIAWLSADLGFADDMTIHELGHGFGFGHASSFGAGSATKIPTNLIDFAVPWASTVGYREYGDEDDNMGGGNNDWSTYWKQRAGWLDPSQIQTVAQSAEYELDQVELTSSGVKMLKIHLGKKYNLFPYGDQETYYFLEYRKPLGLFDTDPWNNDLDDAVQIRLKNLHYASSWGSLVWQNNTVRFLKDKSSTGGYDQYMDANIDQPFFDPYRGVKVELLEKTGEGADSKARVRVTFSGVDLSPNNLMKYVEYENDQNPQILTVSNNTTSSLDIGQITVAGRNPSSFNIVKDNTSNKTIPVGGSATVSVHFSPTTSSQKFAYLNIPTNNDLRPNATISLYGRDNDGPEYSWPREAVNLYTPFISTNVSSTNIFNISYLVIDSFSTVAGYQIQYHPHTTTTWRTLKVDGQYWTPKTKTTFTGKPGYTYYFRVRAKDQAGNIGDFSDIHATIVPFDNVSLYYSPNWKSANPSSSFKGTTNYTYTKGAFASLYFFTGGSLTLIAPKGPNRGKMDVYIRDKVNGVWTSYKKVKTIDQYSSTYKSKVPINLKPWDWDSTWYVPRSHQIKFVATGKKNTRSTGTRVVIDGLAVEKNPYDGY